MLQIEYTTSHDLAPSLGVFASGKHVESLTGRTGGCGRRPGLWRSNQKNREASSVFINGKWVPFSAIATPFLGVFVILLELEAGPLEGVGLGAIITAGVWCPRAAALLGCNCGRVIRQKATSSPCLHEEVGHVCSPRGLVFEYRLLFLWHLISYHKRKSPS